jgi:predicted nucleic acid-binding protein
MVYTVDSAASVPILVSQKKWAKAKRLLATLPKLVFASEWVDHKVLERIRGSKV